MVFIGIYIYVYTYVYILFLKFFFQLLLLSSSLVFSVLPIRVLTGTESPSLSPAQTEESQGFSASLLLVAYLFLEICCSQLRSSPISALIFMTDQH